MFNRYTQKTNKLKMGSIPDSNIYSIFYNTNSLEHLLLRVASDKFLTLSNSTCSVSDLTLRPALEVKQGQEKTLENWSRKFKATQQRATRAS